jgi:hypothetical protein
MPGFTVGKYLATRFEQIGLRHYFMVPWDSFRGSRFCPGLLTLAPVLNQSGLVGAYVLGQG